MTADPPPSPTRTSRDARYGAFSPSGLSHLRKRLGAPDRRTAWAVLRSPGVRRYFVGSLVSNLGTWFQNTAQVLLAYQLTGAVMGVGMVTAAQYAGALVLGPWAAVLADRIGGVRTLVGAQLFSGALSATMAVLALTGALTEPLLIAGALGLGFAFTFALPVQTAILARLVETDDPAEVEAAMALNSVSYNIGRTLAPALCVALVLATGFAWPFAINAVSFVVFALLLARARPRRPESGTRPAKPTDGMVIARQQQRILLLLAMVAAVTLADDPILVLGPALTRQLGVPGDWAGYFVSALGLGTVLASFAPRQFTAGLVDHTLARVTPRRHAAAREASVASRRAAVYLLLLAMAMICYVMGISAWLSALAALLAGGAALVTGAITQGALVLQHPGRAASVMTLWAIAWAGTKPVASLLDGWLASHLGTRWAGMLLAAPALTLGLLEILLSPGLKEKIKSGGRRALDRGHLAPVAVGAGDRTT